MAERELHAIVNEGDEAWRVYPYTPAPGNPAMRFPEAEGHQDVASDTYYASGIVQGERSGRQYAFLVIFAQLSGPVRALGMDMHIAAFFDLASGGYMTCASYDLPPWRWLDRRLMITRGALEVGWDSPGWTSRLMARRDEAGALVPFGYTLDVQGRDSHGRPLALNLVVDAIKPPQPVGGPAYDGTITVMGQPGTYSYFQSLRYRGSLRWRGMDEPVSGAIGWLDRQWFPQYVGSRAGALADRYGHHWSQLSLDNGWECSLWRHFARHERNRIVPFSGLTITDPDGRTSFTDEYHVDILSYCRDEGYVTPLYAPVQRAFGARPDVRYFFDAYRLQVPALDLVITSMPLAHAPAHRMPVDYLSGPTRLEGTMGGRPVTGYGFNERTLALSRPWELQQALVDSLRHLASLERAPVALADRVAETGSLINGGQEREARTLLEREVRPALEALAEPQRRHLLRLCGDLVRLLR